jgi:hypothetical protein
MKDIKMEPGNLVLCHHRPELPGGCEYVLLNGKEGEAIRSIGLDNYLESMSNA